MFLNINSTNPAAGGFDPQNFDIRAISKAAGAISVGDFVVFDMTAAGIGVTSTDPGGPIGTSIYSSIVAPNVSTTQLLCGYGAVALSTVAGVGSGTGNELTVRMFGIVPQAFIIYSAGSSAIGDPLIGTLAKNLDGVTTTTGAKFFGRALAVVTTPTVRTLSKVEINGYTGFGSRP